MPEPALVLNSIRDGSFRERLQWRARRVLPSLGERNYDTLRMKAHVAEKLGRWPNTAKPETYNDHVLANLLAHDKSVLKNFVTDKEFAKIYVRHKCPEILVPETYSVLRSEEEIRNYEFPVPCMVKPTHSSARAIAHRVGDVDLDKVVNYLKHSYYESSREPHYKHLDHKVIVEELLECPNEFLPSDWKVHCFFGKPKMVWRISGRGLDPVSRYYSSDWEPLPISSLYPLDSSIIPQPPGLENLLEYASILASDLRFCRVDMYMVGESIYFGEITPYSGTGSQPWRHAGAASSLDVDRALAPLFEVEDADPRLLLSRAGLMAEGVETKRMIPPVGASGPERDLPDSIPVAS